MNHKETFLKIFLSAVFFLGIGLVTLFPDFVGLCNSDNRDCIYPLAFNVGEPLTIWMLLFIPSTLFVFFFRSVAFNAWKKFAFIYIPLSAIWIVLTPVSCGGGILSTCLDKELISWLTASGFLLITLILLALKKLRGKSESIS